MNSSLQRLHIICVLGTGSNFYAQNSHHKKGKTSKGLACLDTLKSQKRDLIIQVCFAVHGHVSVKCRFLKRRLVYTNISLIFVSGPTRWLTKTLCSSPSSRNYAEIHNLCTANFLFLLISFWFSPTVNARSIIPTLYLGKAAAWRISVKQTTPATKKPNA